ncbi:MAG: hypothetical protein ABIO96_08945 [Nitrospiraceae bacterium]
MFQSASNSFALLGGAQVNKEGSFLRFAAGCHSFSHFKQDILEDVRSAEEKDTGLRSFLPIDLYKSTRRKRLNLYRYLRTPDADPTSSRARKLPHSFKTLLQRGIQLLFG